MPKAPRNRPPDGSTGATNSRTVVERWIDRIKNNRLAAALMVACIGIGAVASLTDSSRKLGEVYTSLRSVDVTGQWKTMEANFHPSVGPEFMRLYLTQPMGDQLVGVVQFSGNAEMRPTAFNILEGKRTGKSITLSFHGRDILETVDGELAGDELHVVLHIKNQGAVVATAKRIVQSSQIIDGRFAIRYRGQEFADPRTACTKLLGDLDPPERYVTSEPPDGQNIHCVGKPADGSRGFDQYQNEVQWLVVCPALSRATIIDGTQRPTTMRACECDGDLVATGQSCMPRH
jgi:hypothetical protein